MFTKSTTPSSVRTVPAPAQMPKEAQPPGDTGSWYPALLCQPPRHPCRDASTGLCYTGGIHWHVHVQWHSPAPSRLRAEVSPVTVSSEPHVPDLPYWALATPSKASPGHSHQHTHQGAGSLFCRNMHPHAQLLAILPAKKTEARQIF